MSSVVGPSNFAILSAKSSNLRTLFWTAAETLGHCWDATACFSSMGKPDSLKALAISDSAWAGVVGAAFASPCILPAKRSAPKSSVKNQMDIIPTHSHYDSLLYLPCQHVTKSLMAYCGSPVKDSVKVKVLDLPILFPPTHLSQQVPLCVPKLLGSGVRR